MTEVIKFRNNDEIRERASEWIMRLDAPDIEEDIIQSLLLWLDESPVHRVEFIELASIWGNMDILSELAEMIPLDPPPAKRRQNRGIFNVSWNHAAAASVCITVLLGLHLFKDNLWPTALPDSSADIVYSTPIGDQNSINLVDGSRINMNTNSSVRVGYNSEFRDIYLEHGEVHFEVAHNPQRPFVVHVGNGSVTAKGTAFTVQYYDSLVDVTVTDGIVEVNTAATKEIVEGSTPQSSTKTGTTTKTSISAGQTVKFDEVIRFVGTVAPGEMDRKLAWQRGMLIFDGNHLEDVIIEIARYTDTKIVINDQAIRKVQVGGYFRTGEINAMLGAFESSFGIAVTRVDENLIYLSKKSDFIAE